MEMKKIPSKTFYCAEKTLTIPEISQFADTVLEPMYKDAEKQGLEISGPPEFIYRNSTGEPGRPFHLLIGIPVAASKPASGDFFFLETRPFDCASAIYRGSMLNLGNAWKQLVQEVLEAGYLLGNQGREIYTHWVSFESEDNITELQVGVIARKVA